MGFCTDALGEDRRRFGKGDQLAQAEEDVLVAGQAVEAAAFQHDGQRAHAPAPRSPRRRRCSGAPARPAWPPSRCSRRPRLEMQLPAVAGDRPLHDLRRAFVDGGDAHVALDLLDHVFLGVAVAAQRLDRIFGGLVAALRWPGTWRLRLRSAGPARRRRCARPSIRCRRARLPAGRRSGRSVCGCSPASGSAARRPGCASASREWRACSAAQPAPRPKAATIRRV